MGFIDMPEKTKIIRQCKWDADGSCGHSKLHQTSAFSESSSDGDLLLLVLLPLRMMKKEGNITFEKICGPLRLDFVALSN